MLTIRPATIREKLTWVSALTSAVTLLLAGAAFAVSYFVTSRAALERSLPIRAEIIGLTDRGLLRPGNHADVVIFDLGALEDRSTILDPHQYPEGIEYVMVNGQLTVDQGNLTGALPGRVLDRNEEKSGAGAVSD